jgi:hypothetical protein
MVNTPLTSDVEELLHGWLTGEVLRGRTQQEKKRSFVIEASHKRFEQIIDSF